MRDELTLDELRSEAVRRFGPDPLDWSFQCPNCGDVAAAREWPEELRGGAGQECIGRVLNGDRGCTRAAYGIPGTWTITLTIRCFPLAEGRPAGGPTG